MSMCSARYTTPAVPLVIAYLRVSSDQQAESGLGLAAQRAAIEAYAIRQGVQIDRWATDAAVSGSVHPRKRPGLSGALASLGAGALLIVAKGDRIARKTRDLLELRDLAEVQGWTLAAADGSVDWSTPHRRAMSGVMSVFAELERDLIRARTTEALGALLDSGVRLGPAVQLPEPIRQRIRAERAAGATMAAIADRLTAEGVPTPTGKRTWYPSSVKSVLCSLERDAYAASRAAA